jgi:hypothetical protein
MPAIRLELVLLKEHLAVCRLPAGADVPGWAVAGEFVSVTRTSDELSVVCGEAEVPEGVQADRGWRALRVAGTLELSLVGVLASLANALAGAGVSLFAVSTFDTDYLLVRGHDLERATAALRADGHAVHDVDAGPPAVPTF